MSRRTPRPAQKAPAAAADSPTRDALLAFACVAVASCVVRGELALPPASAYAFGLVAGVIAALACRRWWIAAASAGLGVIGGVALGAIGSPAPAGTAAFPLQLWVAAILAACVAAAASEALRRRVDLECWACWLGVALVVVTAWTFGWYGLAHVSDGSSTPARLFMSSPELGASTSDLAVYVLTVRRMHEGEGYYSATGQVLASRSVAAEQIGRQGAAVDLHNPTAFRLPTLYWLLAALPQTWQSWGAAMLFLITAATVAAWSIARTYVHAAVALAGTAVTGMFLAGYASFFLPSTEPWAGALALAAVALGLKSLSARRGALVLACAAAAVALLATLTRELAVAFVLVGLAASLVSEGARSRRLWLPWAVALGAFVVAYVLHARAVAAVVPTLPTGGLVVSGGLVAYLDPTGAGLASALAYGSVFIFWTPVASWVVWGLGVLGGLAGPWDRARRVLLGAAVLGGSAVLFLMHPTAAPGARVPGYWGFVVLPTVIACAPLALSRLPGLGRPRSDAAA